MTGAATERRHATTVAIDGAAVLIEGPPGSGKSDLALCLIDRGATLVADDQTIVTREGDGLVARSPDAIRGRMEVRGLGIVPLAPSDDVPVALLVAIGNEAERMPRPARRDILGVAVRAVTIDPFRASAPIKVELALRHPEVPPA